jgi:hypothetical protein
MKRAIEQLSLRAKDYVERVGYSQGAERLSEGEVRTRFADHVSERHLERLCEFEAVFGGLRIDETGTDLDMGLRSLLLRGVEPEIVSEPELLVLVGSEQYADIFLSASGELWWSGPDRQIAPLASSARKYIERLAALAPVEGYAPYGLATTHDATEIAARLGLEVDEESADSTFLLYGSERYKVYFRLRGTRFETSSVNVECRTYEDLVGLLLQSVKSFPDLRLVLGTVHPSISRERHTHIEAPSAAKLTQEHSDNGGFTVDLIPRERPEQGGFVTVFPSGRIEQVETFVHHVLGVQVTGLLSLAEGRGIYRFYQLPAGLP